MEYAALLRVREDEIISVCPFDGTEDTLRVTEPLGKVICMSTSHIAFLDAIGCDSVVCGVSGAAYVSSRMLRERFDAGLVYDVGYDQTPDYERIVALQPDVLLAYRVSAAESPFLAKLSSLGVRVFTLYEFLEDHPLGRAEYFKAFGTMTGRRSLADSLFAAIANDYNLIAKRIDDQIDYPQSKKIGVHVHSDSLSGLRGDSLNRDRRLSDMDQYYRSEDGYLDSTVRIKVLMNIPYGDVWYVPGGESYMARLVRDAGGEILGAKEGESQSRAITVEEAYVLSKEADCWLNPGWCRSRRDLDASNPMFKNFRIPAIYNNTRRVTSGGGNDFWESGYVNPQVILKDLRTIFDAVKSGKSVSDSLYYYIEVK